MEAGNVDTIIRDPKHPYTQLLVGSIPWPDPNLTWGNVEDLIQKSQVAFEEITGCKFAPRCPKVHDICHTAPPTLFGVESDRAASCYLYKDSPVVAREDIGSVFGSAA